MYLISSAGFEFNRHRKTKYFLFLYLTQNRVLKMLILSDFYSTYICVFWGVQMSNIMYLYDL